MAKKKSLIKPQEPFSGERIKLPTIPVDNDIKPPIFSLERVQNGNYCLSSLDQEHKAAFADAIFRRRNITWNQLKQLDRHGLGTEKIPKRQIKTGIPRFITDDLDHFIVFRFHGRAPMVGYRVGEVFYVLWFDWNFTLYDH